MMRAEGQDAEREAQRLSLDEVRRHLAKVVLPRLIEDGLIVLPPGGLGTPDAAIYITERYWNALEPYRAEMRGTEVASVLRHTGEHAAVRQRTEFGVERPVATGSILEARSLVKT